MARSQDCQCHHAGLLPHLCTAKQDQPGSHITLETAHSQLAFENRLVELHTEGSSASGAGGDPLVESATERTYPLVGGIS